MVDEGTFRRAVSRFATGVCVLTTVEGGQDYAMTANAFCSVSLDPPLVLACVEVDARFHDAVLATGTWAVSVLEAGARPVAEWLSTPGRPLHGQLATVAHRRGPHTGAALLDRSLATLECRTAGVYPGGDHSIVVGAVLGAGLPDTPGPALVFHRGGYGQLP